MKSLFKNKRIWLVLFISLIISELSISQSHYVGLKAGMLNHRWAEVGVGYAYAPNGESGDYYPGLIISPTLGMEFNYATRGEERKIYAPKFSLEAHYVVFGARLNIIDYQTQGQHDWRFRPEAGFSLFGLANVFYGYNISLSENKFAEVQPHKLSICINLPLIKL